MDTNNMAFRILIAVGLFFVVQLFYVFSKVENLDEGKSLLEAQIESLERKRDVLRMKLNEIQREIYRSEKRQQQLEIKLRDQTRLLGASGDKMPMIYFVTPTSFRPAQKADLVRLSQTLAQVPNLHWIVVEDSDRTSKDIREIIQRFSFCPPKPEFRTKLPFTHIFAKTPTHQKMKYDDPNWKLPRGVLQRNAALNWLRKQLSSAKKGVLYFGDDDNTYDWRLFAEMRKIQVAGIWPVGIVGGMFVEGPELFSNGTISSFKALWKPERPFPIDMAAFAVNITLLMQYPNVEFSFQVARGFQVRSESFLYVQESHFLSSLGLSKSDLEPQADLCTKVYVWHTRTEKTKLSKQDQDRIINYGVADFSEIEADALGIDL